MGGPFLMAVQAIGGTSYNVIGDAQVSGGAIPQRLAALGDGSAHVATAGIARAVDLSSVPASIAANGNTPNIDVSPFSVLYWFGLVSAVSGGSTPKIDFYLDYTDSQGNIIGYGIQHLTQFTGAGSNGVNVGPIAGGAAGGGSGYVIPATIQVRWVLTGGGTWTGVTHSAFGR